MNFDSLAGDNLLLVTVPATAAPNGILTLDTCTGTTWDTEIVVSGPLQGGLCPANQSFFTCAGANDDACGTQSRVQIATQPGATHAVLVTGFGDVTGAYTLRYTYEQPSRSITPSPTPTSGMASRSPNATFAPPTCVTGGTGITGQYNGSTLGGSAGFGGNCGGVDYNGADSEQLVLIRIPPGAAPGGQLTVDTCTNVRFDTEVVVARAPGGSCPTTPGSFVCIGANDDACGVGSRVTVPATPGDTFSVLVTGFGTAAGGYTLSWSYIVPSPTRTPNAQPRCVPVTGVRGSYLGATSGASVGFNGTCGFIPYADLGGQTVVLLTVPTTGLREGMLAIDTCGTGTSFDTELAVSAPIAGGACPTQATGFRCLLANDDFAGCSGGRGSRVAFWATAGTTYGVLVSGASRRNGHAGNAYNTQASMLHAWL